MSGVERYTHFVGDMLAIDEAMQDGTPVGSVCGKVWVPSRDPDAFALCPTCVDIVRRAWCA